MTRDRVKSIHDKVNSLLSTLELDITLDGLLPHIYVYVSLGTNLAKDPKEASRSRGEGSHMVHGRRREDRREEGEALQPPATTRPALPPPPGRHCRWAHPGTAAPLTPALPAQPAEDATETRPALPPHLPRHCRPHRHCRPKHAGTAGPPRSQLNPSRLFIIYGHHSFIVMPLLPLDGSGPIYTSLPTSFRFRQD
jgi:hypothetical protein